MARVMRIMSPCIRPKRVHKQEIHIFPQTAVANGVLTDTKTLGARIGRVRFRARGIPPKFMVPKKLLQKLIFIIRSCIFGALVPPLVSGDLGDSASDLGDRGGLELGSWNLGSGDHPGRAIWESNLGRGSWNPGAGEHLGRATWESNLGRLVSLLFGACAGVIHVLGTCIEPVASTCQTYL